MADEIVIKYTADISNLEKNLNKVEKDLLAVEKDSKKAMGTLSTESNKTAASIQKVDKHVNTLGSTLSNLSNNLPFAGAIQEVEQFGGAILQTGQAAQGASKGFGILRIAVTAVLGPIALIIGAIVSLIAFFKRTDEGATKLEGILGAVGAVINDITGFIAEFGSSVFDALSSVESFQEALSNLGEFILNNLINRFKSILVYAEAISLLFEGKFKEAAKKTADAFIQMNTGIENSTDKMIAYGEKLAKAAQEAYDFAVAMDAISDAQRELNVQLSENRIRIVELIKQSKNHSLSIDERIKKLQQANALDEDGLKKTLALEQQKLELISKRNKREQDAINQRLNMALAEAKTEEEKIKLREKTLHINDDLAQEEADQQIKINNLKTESVALQERNNSAIAALREQAIQEELKDAQIAAEKKENIQKQSLLNQEINREEFEKRSFEILLESLENQKAILIKYGKDTTDIDKAILDAKLKQLAEQEKQAKELNDKQLKDAHDDAEFYAKLSKQMKDKALEEEKKRIDKEKALRKQAANEVLNITDQTLTGINDLQLARQAEATNNEQLANEKKTNDLIANLEKRKEAGLISEADFNAQKARIEAQAKQKESALKKKQFEADQKAAITKINIDTAIGIAKTFANLGFPAGIIPAAALFAQGEIQKAFIRSQPVPKFAEGGEIKGNKHSSGGVHIEAEGGEYITNARQTSRYKPVLSAINDGYFDKYVNDNYIIPAMKNEEARKRKLAERQASTADNIMKALELNGFGDLSHLERLTKSNKKVEVANLKSLPSEIGKEFSRSLAANNYMK